MQLSGWGNYPVVEATVKKPLNDRQINDILALAPSVIGRGLGRAYGDSALNLDLTLSTARLVRCSARKNTDLFWATCGGDGPASQECL